jgi:hypothetical protein
VALNIFDPAKHHVGFKPVADSNTYGFLISGGYRRDVQLEGQPEASVGGGTDLSRAIPGLSRWSQDDFTGGGFQYQWGKDDGMFASCQAMIPNPQATSLLTIPPVKVVYSFDPASQSNPASLPVPIAAFDVAGSLYFVFEHGTLRYQTGPATGTWSSNYASSTNRIKDAQWDRGHQCIWLLRNRSGAVPQLCRLLSDQTLPSTMQTFDLPANMKDARGLEVNFSQVVVSVDNVLYAFNVPDRIEDQSFGPAAVTAAGDATGAKWTSIGRLPGRWVDSVAYNGLVYILCGAADDVTSVVAFDGGQILPIADFPFNFTGQAMASYGGRIFCVGTGTDLSGNARYAEVYEITGGMLRLVRTFQPESYTAGAIFPKDAKHCVVADGLLWFPSDGDKLYAYDITSDGFFGASDIPFSSNQYYKLVVGRERLYAWAHDATAGARSIHRIAQIGDSVSSWSGEFTTSDFTLEPGRMKRWSEMRVLTKYGAAAMEYSTDGGVNFTALSVNTATDGDFRTNVADLTAIAASPYIRFRFTLPRGTDVAGFTELLGFTMSFIFVDTGKRAWSFTLNVADEVEGQDGLSVPQDVDAIIDALFLWATEKTPLVFTDINGDQANISIGFASEIQPVIGARGPGGSRVEAIVSLTFGEV